MSFSGHFQSDYGTTDSYSRQAFEKELGYFIFKMLFLVPQPSVVISQSLNGSNSGLNHTLTCTVIVANGVSSSLVIISWIEGSLLSSSPRITVSDETNVGVVYTRIVTFSPLLNGDGGQYTCSASLTSVDEASNSDSVMVVVNGMFVHA